MCDGVTGCATGCVCRLSVTMCVCRAVCVPECYENSLTLWPTMCAIICYVCVHMCVCLCVWVCMRRWHWLWQGQPTAPGQAQPGQAQLSSTQGRARQEKWPHTPRCRHRPRHISDIYTSQQFQTADDIVSLDFCHPSALCTPLITLLPVSLTPFKQQSQS